MRSLIVVALSLTVVVAAGCSGSDDADPATTSGTAAPETTPAPPATDPTSTTATTIATTSAPPTTQAPTTTLDPTAALIADIEADLNAGEQAFLAAGADPSNPQLRDELSKYFSGEVLERTLALVDGWAADGLRVRPNESVASALVVFSLIDRDGSNAPTSATVEVCRIDAAVVYEPLPDGREAIVNDQIYRSVTNAGLEFVDDVWRARSGTTTSETTASTTCDE